MRGLIITGLAMILGLNQAFASEEDIKASLDAAMPGIPITEVKKSALGGLFEVHLRSGEVIYSSADGKRFITGELYSTDGGKITNLTEVLRETQRTEQLAKVGQDEKITFPAVGTQKAHITVFTDIDCGYCRRLHQEIPEMNEMGISVSYMAFPRAGIGSESYNKIVSAWCAEDPLQAMTDAKAGRSIERKTCDNPVAAQYQLGDAIGVNGTPAIIMDNGKMLPGYMPAKQLAQAIGL